MRPEIVFLHTSPLHVPTFATLVKAIDPTLRIAHRVVESLLSDAQRLGADDPILTARVHAAMLAAAKTGAAIVVCTCSSIGGCAERTPTEDRFQALRIDRAMADRAVRLGPGILIVAALESTLAPTIALIRESATDLNLPVDIESVVASGAWPLFINGRHDEYVNRIAQTVRAYSGTATVVVLAQASMAPAQDELRNFTREVLSSSALGVQWVISRLTGHAQ